MIEKDDYEWFFDITNWHEFLSLNIINAEVRKRDSFMEAAKK